LACRLLISHTHLLLLHFCFFFQAEDGIRDRNVTGVQTCALPISSAGSWPEDSFCGSSWQSTAGWRSCTPETLSEGSDHRTEVHSSSAQTWIPRVSAPSMSRFAPDVRLDRGLDRNTTLAAVSSGVPMRPVGLSPSA